MRPVMKFTSDFPKTRAADAVKLLWESCQWVWEKMIPEVCQRNKLKEPRSKFKEQHKKHLVYSKLRKKSYQKTKARKRVSLYLLSKGIIELQRILNETKVSKWSTKESKIFKTI